VRRSLLLARSFDDGFGSLVTVGTFRGFEGQKSSGG
jgi:hypothetical protein